MNPTRWHQIAPSEYRWEQEALAFLRQGLPDHEPYRAWANFEVIAEDGSIHEIDLLVLSPKGFFRPHFEPQARLVFRGPFPGRPDLRPN